MTSQDGRQYDLDFIVHGEEPETLAVENIFIHAVNDQTRYEWLPNVGSKAEG